MALKVKEGQTKVLVKVRSLDLVAWWRAAFLFLVDFHFSSLSLQKNPHKNAMNNNTPMDIAIIKEEAIRLLNECHGIYTLKLPSRRPKSEWEDENRRGFFLGIIQKGDNSDMGLESMAIQSPGLL